MNSAACMYHHKNVEEDIFRRKPYRYLGYANEIGESFRHLVPWYVVTGSYGVSSVYVVAHAVHKGTDKSSPHPYQAFLDTLVWQGLASVIIPGITINRICASTRWLLSRRGVLPLTISWGVVSIGLVSIPIIVNPIDRLVDKLMDSFVRSYYDYFKAKQR